MFNELFRDNFDMRLLKKKNDLKYKCNIYLILAQTCISETCKSFDFKQKQTLRREWILIMYFNSKNITNTYFVSIYSFMHVQ